jgi:subtilisin-like proprotein convertase family protein
VTSSSPLSAGLQSIIALPSLGIQADDGTPTLPLVYVGDAAAPLQTDLAGKAALIRRGNPDFSAQIKKAADAGAGFAIVYNNEGTNTLEIMDGTDYVPIPAVFITQHDGDALANAVTNAATSASLQLATADYEFDVTNSLACEQVQAQVTFTHAQRGDLRLTLLSPMGTRSVLQRLGADANPFNGTWTYMTTHHFFESAQGKWRLSFSDEAQGGTGTVQSVSLIVSGVAIKDTDHDGLDDDWEMAHFASLQYGPADDPDQDGYSNAREQVLRTAPARNESPLAVNLSLWSRSILRLNWPSRVGQQYEILAAAKLKDPFTVIATTDGGFPRTAWYGKIVPGYQFFKVREKQ